MKTLLINGVPYVSNAPSSAQAQNTVSIYGLPTGQKLVIGSYENENLTLNSTWKEDSQAWLQTYRNGLKDATTHALAKAAELQKAS